MRYADIKLTDVANGTGVRTSLFVSGCTHHCEGCFNQVAWDFDYGNEWTKEVEDSFIEACKRPYIAGVSILGGEPFQQDVDTMVNLLKRIHDEVGKSVWCWTGYRYEDIVNDKDKLRILEQVDVLIDGKFELDKKDLRLKWRGSSNQRVIDVPYSLYKEEVKFHKDMGV